MEKSIIFGFISSLKSCLLDDPNMNHWQINKRLQFLGWDDFEMDYHTLQLAKECFEAEGLKSLQTYSD
ncbi:MAG: hypothetical protein U9N83_12940 [Thermodesulfobacteriota bacterium]|nr:hypothetical protein [Thermodesulfobacteriota bacterium]